LTHYRDKITIQQEENSFFFHQQIKLNLRKELVDCYIWSIAFYGAETLMLQKIDQKCMEGFEMWCWRRIEKISWTDHARNEEVLYGVKEERNIIYIH